jgi:hypothetical protein
MDLVEAVERAEVGLMLCLDGVSDPVREQMGISSRRFGDGVAIVVANDPSDYWSQALGFGFDRPVTEDLVGEVVDFYRGAGARVMNLGLAPEVVPPDWALQAARAGRAGRAAGEAGSRRQPGQAGRDDAAGRGDRPG